MLYLAKRPSIRPSTLLVYVFIAVACAATVLLVLWMKAGAADLKHFHPGNIMSDHIMSDKNSMDQRSIQQFLISKNPCNNRNIHLAQQYPQVRYHIRDGKFVCLHEETFEGESASYIIWKAAQDYSINPQVLIVLLQKEQGLITDTWPNHIQYRSATGFGCPDTADCDAQYYGFRNQVRKAAELFRRVLDGGWSNYPVGLQYIQYHPRPQCGGSVVHIQNRATSALYRYTPYQPNSSALRANYGNGDQCGAYGNRNFYLYFTDWFGSTTGIPIRNWEMRDQGEVTGGNHLTTNHIKLSPTQSKTLYLKAKNTGNQVWHRYNTFLATARPLDRKSKLHHETWLSHNRAAQLKEGAVKPGEVGTFILTVTAPNDFTTLQEYFNIVHEGIAWSHDIGFYFIAEVAPPRDNSYNVKVLSSALYYDRQRTQPIVENDSRVRVGQEIYGEVVFKNMGGATINNALVRLATTQPNDRQSTLHHASWMSPTRLASPVEATVKPSENGRVHFTLRAPQTPSLITEHYALVAEGITWINNSTIAHRLEITPNYPSQLTSAQLLNVGHQLVSESLRYRLILQADGNLVLYNNSTAIWNSGTTGVREPVLILQADGNLVLYAKGSKPVWNSGTVTGKHAVLRLQDDGNMVIYAAGNRPFWSTGTSGS